MQMKCGSAGIPAPMTELCTQILTLFQTNDRRKLTMTIPTRTSCSLSARTARVVRVENRARLFTLLSLHIRHATRTALIHTKKEMRDGVSRPHLFVPKVVVQLPLLVRHHEDLGGVGVQLYKLAQCSLVSPPRERLPEDPSTT